MLRRTALGNVFVVPFRKETGVARRAKDEVLPLGDCRPECGMNLETVRE